MAYGIIEDGDGEQIRPPTGPLSAEINRTSPLSRGLIRLFAPAAREYKGKSKGLIALGSSSIIKNTSLITASSAGTISTIGLLGEMSGATAYTMLAIATPSSLTTRMPLLGYDWYSGIPYWGFGTGYGDSSQVFAYLDTSNYVSETAPGFFVAGERHLYAMTASNSAGVTFYKDKTASVGTIVGSFANAPAIPAQSLSVGGGSLGGGTAWEGAIELVAYWDRVLSAFEIARIVDNPWQLFEADNDPVFYSLGGGGGAAALEGSLAASGTVSGALTTAIQAAASVSGSASVTAALSTAIRPAASVSASATVSAALTTAIQMAGSLSATASVTGDISGAAALASSVSTSAIVTGDLTTAIRLNASVSGAATVTGVLAEPGAAAALEASIAASATVSASLTGGSSTIWTPASASSGTWTPASAAGGTWVAQ